MSRNSNLKDANILMTSSFCFELNDIRDPSLRYEVYIAIKYFVQFTLCTG